MYNIKRGLGKHLCGVQRFWFIFRIFLIAAPNSRGKSVVKRRSTCGSIYCKVNYFKSLLLNLLAGGCI